MASQETIALVKALSFGMSLFHKNIGIQELSDVCRQLEMISS
jgi:hypothetical protein